MATDGRSPWRVIYQTIFFLKGNEISNVIYILHFNTCCAIFTITYWSMENNRKEVSIYTSTESCEIVEIITILSILETLGLSASWPFYVITSLAFWLVSLLLFTHFIFYIVLCVIQIGLSKYWKLQHRSLGFVDILFHQHFLCLHCLQISIEVPTEYPTSECTIQINAYQDSKLYQKFSYT